MNNNGTPSGKKPYEKPAVVSEKVFETSALVCGKCPNSNQMSLGGACVRGRPSAS